MHYLIIIVIIAVIVIFQIQSFNSTIKKLSVFKNVFANRKNEYRLQTEKIIEAIKIGKWNEHSAMLQTLGLSMAPYIYTGTTEDGVEESYYHREQVIDLLIENAKQNNKNNRILSSHENAILATIIDSINNYLANNSGKDFHLMKDIVDRNCDASEEEVHTQIPVPLYFGLVGTMAGILIGVGFLVFSGSLDALLSEGVGNNSTEGVKALLGGVAIAMISSIFGITLTTWGANKAKTAKANIEKNKNTFLSWLQAELLPKMDDNITHTLEVVASNLTEFNNTFTKNTSNLSTALAKVNESYRLQTQLLEAVNKVADKDVTIKNLQLYNALKNSTDEIGTLAEYLHNTNEYLAHVKSLNEKLDLQENRTMLIEEMGAFFKTELTQIEARKGAISKAVGTVDDYLQQALEKLKENTETQLLELQKSTIKQQDLLQKKTEEINIVVDELKKLTAVKDSISKFEKTMNVQNSKLDNLANAIHSLAKAKTEGTNISAIDLKKRIPTWKKVFIKTSIAIGIFLLIVLGIANWSGIYSIINDIFKI